MASRISELIVKIGAQTGDFKKALAQTTRDLESQAAKLSNVGATFGVGLSAPILGLGAAAVKAFGDLDALKRGLATVSTSAAEAERMLSDLREVAKLPGLGFREAVQGAVNLRAVGFSADQTKRILGEFGNALAGVGRGKEDLNEVIRQLGQLSSRGKVTADNLKPIIERVPQAAAIIRKEFGTIDTEQLQKLGVSSEVFIQKLLDGLGKLPRATGGIKNELENLRDTGEQALSQLGEAIAPVATAFIRSSVPVIESVGAIAQAFQQLPSAVQNGVFALVGIAASVGPISLAAAAVVRMRSAIVDLLKLEFAQSIIVQFVAIRTAAAGATGAIGTLQAVMAGIAASSIGTAIAAAFTPIGIAVAGIALHLDNIRKAWRDLRAELDNDAFLKTLLRRFPEMSSAAKQAASDLGFFAKQSDDTGRAALSLSQKQAAANTALKAAFSTLRVDGPQKSTDELSKLKSALDTVRQAYKDGTVDAAAVTRATEAYNKAVKDLTGGLQTLEQRGLVAVRSLDDLAQKVIIPQKFQDGVQKAGEAVAAFILASEPIGTKLPTYVSQFGESLMKVVPRFNADMELIGYSIRTITDELAIASDKFEKLARQTSSVDPYNLKIGDNRPIPQIQIDPRKDKRLEGTYLDTNQRMKNAGIDNQAELNARAKAAGDLYERVNNEVKAGTRNAKDAKRAYEEWIEAEKKAAGITDKPSKAQKELARQVSTIVTDLSRSITKLIFEGGKVGQVFKNIGLEIAKSFTRLAIEQGVDLLIKSLGKLLLKVIDVGGTFGKIFGTAGKDIGKTASTIGSTAASGGESAAAGGGGGGGGSILDILGNVANVLSYVQGRRMEQDIGRIEVTSRSIMNDLANLRADEWSRFNSNWLRLGEILTAVRGVYDGLSQINFSGLGGATAAGTGTTYNFYGPISIEAQGASADEIMADFTRKLKLVAPGFNRG